MLAKRSRYTSAIKKTPFKYPIAKKIAKLMLDGLGCVEVYRRCFDENFIEIESLARRREITNVIYKRLSALDGFLLNQFACADVATSKFILVYSIAKTDSLFFEFLFDKYREALLSEDRHYLSVGDFDDFFESRKQVDLIVSKWGKFTFQCLIKGYRNILVDSGFGRRERKNILVSRVLIHPEVEKHIALIGDTDYLKAMFGDDSYGRTLAE